LTFPLLGAGKNFHENFWVEILTSDQNDHEVFDNVSRIYLFLIRTKS
jgi:hypothetical protein